jgi:hypothetical protein
MATPKGWGGGPETPPPPANSEAAKHSDFENEAQGPLLAQPEGDRRKTDWAVTAMVAALTVLSGNKYLRTFAVFSQQDRELERVRDMLRTSIARRRKNLRRVVVGRRS